MGEHVHEWRAESIDYEGLWIHCIDCREHLSDDEISRRLNATDRLNVDSPIGVGVDEIGGWGEYVAIKREDWTAYVAALEKD